MCGRYVSATPVEELASYFAAEPDPDLAEVARPRYNVPPTELVLGVVEEPARPGAGGGGPPDGDSGEATRDKAGARAEAEAAAAVATGRRIRAYRWGLVPPWAKDLAAGNRTFNARAESVATKPAFRAAFRSRRLLVPATAFYEWRRQPGGKRQPFAFRRADGEPLALAGLWERWRDPSSGVWVRSLTIITADAGPDVAPVHDRQPVVVEPADFERWLRGDPGTADVGELQAVLRPSAPGVLVAHPVDPAVGSTANDSPRLFEPLEGVPEAQPTLPA